MDTENVKKEMWVSEAQKEVWEWKEAVAKQIEGMTMLEAIQYIEEQSQETVEQIKAAQKAKAEKQQTGNGG